MFPITRSVSKYFERENIPVEEREKMLEAAHALMLLRRGKSK